MPIILDGGAGVTFPDTRQQTNAVTMTGGNPRYYAARAWGTFNGSGTVLAAANVASVTRVGTGLFTITFTTPMTNANYSVAGAAYDSGGDAYVFSIRTAPTASSFSVRITSLTPSAGSASTSPVDADRTSFVVFA